MLWICSTRTNCQLALLHWHCTASMENVWWRPSEKWSLADWSLHEDNAPSPSTISVWHVFHSLPACHTLHNVTSFIFNKWGCCWRDRGSMIPPRFMQNCGKFLLNLNAELYDMPCVVVWSVGWVYEMWRTYLCRGQYFMQKLFDHTV